MKVRRAFAAVGLALTCGTAARAQSPVAWSAAGPAGGVRIGATARVALIAIIQPGWHVYSLTQGPGGPIALRIGMPAGQGFALGGSIESPTPRIEHDDAFGMAVELYEGAVRFGVPVRVLPAATAGRQTIRIDARYQACTATLCLPPRVERMSVPVLLTRR